MTAVYALLHFMVDGLCVCALYLLARAMGGTPLVGMFLLYNVLAFLTQPLTGMMADRLKHRHWLLLATMILLALAVLATGAAPFLLPYGGVLVVATLLGMGNSLFHVWGGKQTAVETDNDIWALGVFVSTGALGLAVGALLCSWTLLYLLLLAICVLAIVITREPCIDSAERERRVGDGTSGDLSKTHRKATGRRPQVGNPQREVMHTRTKFNARFTLGLTVAALAVLIVIVALRSWLGGVFTSGLTRTEMTVLAIGLTAMSGKMCGGWISVRLGLVRAVTIMVLTVVVCLACTSCGIAVRLVGLFAVNCTMPVTLYLANVLLPGREGLAFGLLAAALMPAYLIPFL